ncbi:MAG TPA: TIGR03067 domain-containing protein [Gemmata sp.]|nr:TIGR03067 domain-containing protein [Gemmata sp.]
MPIPPFIVDGGGSPVKRDENGVPLAWDPELDVPADACDEARDDHELVGLWEVVSAEVAGRSSTVPSTYEFRGNRLRIVEGARTYDRTFELDPRSDPKRLDSRQKVPQGTIVYRAIYRLDGDTLVISDMRPFRARPTQFVERTTTENDLSLTLLRRVPAPK